jgi:hypothetical protein
MNLDAYEKVKEIWGLRIRNGVQLPIEVIKKIVALAVPIMYCQTCNIILQVNYNKQQNYSWVTSSGKDIKCKLCEPNLKEAYRRHASLRNKMTVI